MKKILGTMTAIILIAAVSCNNNEQKEPTTNNENKAANPDDNQKSVNGSADIPAGMKNILGEWTLDRRLRDDNGNHKVDAEEEKTAIPDVEMELKLNADGTCKFQTVMDGTYKLVPAEDGRMLLAIKDLSGTAYPIKQYINSVTEKELVINTVAGGSGFDIYKRP
jgi:hypothetical protein